MIAGHPSPARPAQRAGARLRRIRRERGLTQAAFAGQLGLSASYYNQLEHDRRPVTPDLAARMAAAAGLDPGWLDSALDAQLLAEIRDTLLPYLASGSQSDEDLQAWVRSAPGTARAVLAMARHAAVTTDQLAELGVRTGSGTDGGTASLRSPHEEVRDFFHEHRNHFAVLDRAAEKLVARWDLKPGAMEPGLLRVLHAEHGVSCVVELQGNADRRRYDSLSRTLRIDGRLAPGQRAFQLALQLGLLDQRDAVDAIVATASGLGERARALARVGLAQYFAGAVLLPYTEFLRASAELRYDIDLLAACFGVGFETVCHRLSTLQRPGARGVPFFFVRTDRAGNISKRQSATTFHFSRTGGSCPLWVVHEAFETPDRIRRQISVMPDGRTYLWIARTVTGPSIGFRSPQTRFAIGLGCDIRHAGALVYSDGLDLADRQAATPIGPGCRSCERTDCAQRAFPPLGRAIATDISRSTTTPYF